jgi:hypothetical protein
MMRMVSCAISRCVAVNCAARAGFSDLLSASNPLQQVADARSWWLAIVNFPAKLQRIVGDDDHFKLRPDIIWIVADAFV